ncbi:hypothetical protein [Petrimonas sulfuriphila]|uniref:hypothetical protein n=1 Tax=Petrimonas sulfuriphila TaxID=285070 RepID=UPI003EB9DF24
MAKEKNLTARLMKQFDVSADDVYFSMLLAMGLPQSEAFIAVFRPLTSGTTALANRHIRENPSINSLITYLKSESGTHESDSELTDEDARELVERYKDKDYVLNELIKASKMMNGKERADALMKIADLQQMRKEENKTEEERVHYYIPLPFCKNCPNKNSLGER